LRGQRKELDRLWNAYLKRKFPGEYDEVVETFGEPSDHWATQSTDLKDLFHVWGTPDLQIYDTYVAGFVSRVVESAHSGQIVMGDVPSDTRLARYFDVCLAEADGKMRRKVEKCVAYLDDLNRMLELARTVPAR
jgi:hypothetical protein